MEIEKPSKPEFRTHPIGTCIKEGAQLLFVAELICITCLPQVGKDLCGLKQMELEEISSKISDLDKWRKIFSFQG